MTVTSDTPATNGVDTATFVAVEEQPAPPIAARLVRHILDAMRRRPRPAINEQTRRALERDGFDLEAFARSDGQLRPDHADFISWRIR